jgi:hypothetical protein
MYNKLKTKSASYWFYYTYYNARSTKHKKKVLPQVMQSSYPLRKEQTTKVSSKNKYVTSSLDNST